MNNDFGPNIPIHSGVPVVAVVLYIKHPEELSVCFAILYAELRTVQGIDSYHCRRKSALKLELDKKD